MTMESYHVAWLSAHPDRAEGWLRDRLAEGFDVHHLDGNHANDDPSNLVLIEHLDHMRIHGLPGNRIQAVSRSVNGPAGKKDWRRTAQYREDRARVAAKRAAQLARLDKIELLP